MLGPTFIGFFVGAIPCGCPLLLRNVPLPSYFPGDARTGCDLFYDSRQCSSATAQFNHKGLALPVSEPFPGKQALNAVKAICDPCGQFRNKEDGQRLFRPNVPYFFYLAS
jgi:hypothetical protein